MEYSLTNINGIKTIIAEMPDSNTTTIEIFVKAGSLYENKKNNGISHFLEHMFFKGGEKYDTPMKVAAALDSIGGDFNAYTGDEYAGYYVKSAPEYIETGIDVLSDMLVNARFPIEEMEREKSVIIQEIMMYEDIPQKLVLEKWKEYYYGDNSYGWSTLGTVENIKSFTQGDFFQHKNALYTKDNILIVIAGKVMDKNKIFDLIESKFKNLTKSKSLDKPKLSKTLPNEKILFIDKKTEQNHIVIGADGFSLHQKEKYSAALLGVILGGNMSSRLFQEIREKQGLCYYISGSHFSQDQDGLFFIRAGIEKERFDEGLKSIFYEIEKMSKGDIEESEFNKAIGYIKGKTQMGIESSDQMSGFLGDQYMLTGKIKSLEEILKNYEKLKIEDIKLIANKLNPDNLYTYYIK